MSSTSQLRALNEAHRVASHKAKAVVLVYATQYMPTGGIESHLREFCSNLTESGVVVDLVVRVSSMLRESESFFRKICRHVYLGQPGGALSQLRWLSSVGVRLLAHRYDALYTNGQGDSVQLFSKLAFRRRLWVHHHHTAGDAADQATWTSGYQQALHKADVVIACSRRNALDMASTLVRQIESIPCFSREVTTSDTKQETSLRFGYYGRLIPEKGILTLCQLSQDPTVHGITFHIWGEGEAYPPAFFTAYPKLHFHGPFSGRKELDGVLNSLDAYVLLSIHPEGLPIALLEVMSAGLPWLATDRGGIPDIACDPLATRVLPTTATYDEIKAAIIALAEDIRAGLLSKTTQKALYEENFSSATLVRRWHSVLGLLPAAT